MKALSVEFVEFKVWVLAAGDKREMILGIHFFRTIWERFAKQTLYTWRHVWEKILPRLVAPLLSGIRMLNTVFRTENCSKSSSELTICEISDSKIFDFSATSSWTKKKVSDFFLQNPETSNNFLSNELSDVFELPKLISWDGFEKRWKKIPPRCPAARTHTLSEFDTGF